MRDAIIDWSERILILVLFASFAVAQSRMGDVVNWTMVALEGMTTLFLLTRRQPLSVSQQPLDWALGFVGTLFPLLARPNGAGLDAAVIAPFAIAGFAISVCAKFSLNRRFGVVAANRGVQARWAYAFVRHPMYLGYVISQVGYLLHNPSWANGVIFAIAWSLQLARIHREENHLLQDADYRAYASKVRFRLVPYVF
jgi:protein-S-isoprenylcysteine O-methyltransferase Ste14